MIGKLLLWLGVCFVISLSIIYFGPAYTIIAEVIIIITICIIVMFYGYRKSYKTYRQDPESSYLIGRMTEGIDHKGKRTQRVKISFLRRQK